MTSVIDLIEIGAKKLRLAEISNRDALREAEILLEKACDCKNWELHLENKVEKNELFALRFKDLIEKRSKRFPLQYLLEQIPFRDVMLKIDERCLIPRPETELLVERVLTVLNDSNGGKAVLDIGTGSGSIAISLAKECAMASIVATDVSEDALEVARENAELNGVQNRIRWVKSDCFEGLKGEQFEAIVSNPPYLSESDFERLQPELQYEPRAALDGGKDGLTIFREIVYNAGNFLVPAGVLFLEVGDGQAGRVSMLLQESGFYQIQIHKDYQGINRIVSGVKNG